MAETKKKQRRFKMPTAYVILLGIIGLIAILSWFIPGTFFDDAGNSFQETGKIGLIAAFFYYPIRGFVDSADLVAFLLVIGGFIGIMMETEAMESGVASLLKKMRGKEVWAIVPLMLLFSFGGTTYGMAEETIAFYPIIVPILILAGYDAMTGFILVAIGAGSGVAASTVNPFAIGAASDAAGIGMGTGMILRWIAWLAMTLGAIIFVVWYSKRVRKNMSKSVLSVEENKALADDAKAKFNIDKAPKISKAKMWGLIVFGIAFLLMIMAVTPWAAFGESSPGAWDGIQLFYIINDWLQQWLFPIFGGLIAFGDYWFMELAMIFLIGFIVLALIFRKGQRGSINSFMSGAKDMLPVAIIIGIARGVKLVLEDTGFSQTIIDSLGNVLSGLNPIVFILVLFAAMLLLSFLIPSTSGLAGASFPIIGGVAAAVGGVELVALSITAFSFASGILNLFTPTSGIVMGGLQIANISYGKYLKVALPYAGMLTVVAVVILIIGTFFI